VHEATLQLVKEVVGSRVSSTKTIEGELFPGLDRARSLDAAEAAVHEAMRALPWVGNALVVDVAREELARRALERAVPGMLALQDDLERAVEGVADVASARKVLIAHETLRRFLSAGLEVRPTARPVEVPAAVVPPLEYMRGIALRLALLVVAIEHLLTTQPGLIADLAHKAFETSQTFRRATRELGLDLTPWADAPPATRARRIIEAARGFWSSLGQEQRRAVDEAWGERVEMPPRWPLPSS
jgi:hypothetical protein